MGYFERTNCLAEVPQIFGNFLGYFEKHNFQIETAVATNWAIFVLSHHLFILSMGSTRTVDCFNHQNRYLSSTSLKTIPTSVVMAEVC